MKERIIILPCNGDSAPSKITWIATQEMVLAGNAELCLSFHQLIDIIEDSGGKAPSLIIVDGCERRCLFNKLLEEGLFGKYQLALTDVGIEPVYLEDITRDDVELTKDAIIAECRPVSSVVPALFPGCCCG
jgi:uncharacterized metal-binding protein